MPYNNRFENTTALPSIIDAAAVNKMTNFPQMSENSRALITGFTRGYNQYLSDTDSGSLDSRCAEQPHVEPITPVDLLTVLLGIGTLPGAENFLDAIFIAAPPGVDPFPTMAVSSVVASETAMFARSNPLNLRLDKVMRPKPPEARSFGSNGWAIGSELSDNERGIVLANPHFPHTGNLRFWQSHVTIPGVLNAMGASLIGFPGPVNIGFNENVAWTHTFSASERFVVYQLALAESDTESLSYIVDEDTRQISRQTMTIEVLVAPNETVAFAKEVYFSSYGPMISIPGGAEWDGTQAFSVKDANLPNFDIVDHWLGLNLADSMDAFKGVFDDTNGLLFNNVMAASKEGEVFYIDASGIADLSASTVAALTTDPTLIAAREAAGFTILPGSSSEFDFTGRVPAASAPMYEGADYVQNSNDSFWLTNLENPITGVSPLYGETDNEQSWRSRHAQVLIKSRGEDDKMSAAEIEGFLFNDRAYLADLAYDALVGSCADYDGTPISVGESSIDLTTACQVMTAWDQTMSKESVGAHLFREFANQFARSGVWENDFDPEDPIGTPNTVAPSNETLQQLAIAASVFESAGIALAAPFGEVQFIEKSTAAGEPSEDRLPLSGADDNEGGFSIFDVDNENNGTLLPRHVYPLANSSLSPDLTEEGYHVSFGTSWVSVVQFTDEGPTGRGLVTMSQSSNPDSPHFDDQTRLYSTEPQLRPLRFTEADIATNLVESIMIRSGEN